MQAITTISKKGSVTARTASGKTCTIKALTNPPCETDHRSTARKLSVRMGWGTELVGGETKEGFAYVPTLSRKELSVEQAVSQLTSAASAFPIGEKDPIRLAAGIRDLMKP
jgi:hypothetical protein